MAIIGKLNKLKVIKQLNFGVYLDGGELGEILMPGRYVPENCKPDDMVEVFIYRDSEDCLIATTEKPFAMVGDFALLQVASVNAAGAFLDWGLPKELLAPFSEQSIRMEEGNWYMVYIFLDAESMRIAASSKLNKFLDILPRDYSIGQEVDLIICTQTEIGYKAIINNQHWGVLYKNEVMQPLSKGEHVKGYIKKIRDDEKIDLSLYRLGYNKVDDITKKIVDVLEKHGGFIEITDKSPAEEIAEIFGVSKKAYKMAIGALYKAKRISLEPNGIKKISD